MKVNYWIGMMTREPILLVRLFVQISMLLCIVSTKAQIINPGSELWNYRWAYDLENNKSPVNSIAPFLNHGTLDSIKWNPWNPQFKDYEWRSVKLLPTRLYSSVNSRFPVGTNDGSFWEGKGFNLNISTGFYYESEWFDLTFYPAISFAQNLSFQIPNNRSNAPFNYPFTTQIDWVQAHGEGSVTQLNLGQSELRFKLKKLALGVSTANEIWGPAKFNPIVLSANSAGIPRMFIETDEPLDIKVGHLGGKMIWGRLNESEFYDQDPSNDQSYLSGLSIAFQPSFLNNMTIGINRVMYRNWFTEEYPFELDDFVPTLSTFFSASKQKDTLNGQPVNDFYDQMVSFTMLWRFPEVGFETYLEFARNDFSGNLVDFLLEPEHSRGYTLGFIKNIKLRNDNLISVGYEHTNLSRSKSFLLRATPPFYQHHIIRQGYTIDGQIIGSGIGPGSSSDNFTTNYYGPEGGLGLRITRTRYNDDYFFSLPNVTFDDHDVQYDLALTGTKIKGKYMITGSLEWNYRFNWYFDTSRDVSNLRASISVTRTIN